MWESKRMKIYGGSRGVAWPNVIKLCGWEHAADFRTHGE